MIDKLPWYLALAFVLCLPIAHAAEPAEFDQRSGSGDFSDFAPVYENEDVYEDESFMYFNKSFGLSIGTGIQMWTGSQIEIGPASFSNALGSALPVIDGSFLFLGDHWVPELGFFFAKHDGKTDQLLDFSLRELQLSAGLRYYFNVGQRSSGGYPAAAYLGFAVSYEAISIENKTGNTARSKNFSTWKVPLLGELPLPIAPSFSAGMDFALKPGSSALNFQARWMPLDSVAKLAGFSDSDGLRLGNKISLTSHVVFMFN